MAFIKPSFMEESVRGALPHLPRLPSFPFYDKLSAPTLSPTSLSPTAPLPGMNVFSNKRRYFDDVVDEELEKSLPKMPKLISDINAPPTLRAMTSSNPMGSFNHSCTSDDCTYCSGLTNLDIAAFYWSMLAMRGYHKVKATTLESSLNLQMPSPPSPTVSKPFSDISYKPPSPSGSLSSLDSEPLSPSSSISSESNLSCSKDMNAKYQCQVCHKSYSHPRLLNRHLQSHTPYKKHHCPRCRKGFNDAFDLKRHIRTHTGIKPFQCHLCEKSFTQVC